MNDSALGSIFNYQRLSDRIATAGQPSEAELAAVAAAGFEAVINLGLVDAPYALADERSVAQALGLDYRHIPVLWERPVPSDLARFIETMEALAGQRVFVHCAANKRVSVFMALYRIRKLGWSRTEALAEVARIWEPEGVWQAFIEQALARPERGRE